MRKLPPVGTRLHGDELWAALRADQTAPDELCAKLSERIPSEKVYLFGSGRAALAALLTATSRLDSRKRVIVPAYTCWSVPAAIVRAGLIVVPAEITPGTLDYDLERLARMDWKDVLAVVSPNLFGLPGDLTRLQGLAEAHDALMIDDAAQALGASLRGYPVGGYGLAGILSFGRGKNITALGGGAALVRDESIQKAMDETADEFRGEPAPPGILAAMKGLAMGAALSPSVYGLASSMPGVVVGRTVYEPQFSTAAMGNARAALASRVLERLDAINQRRGQLAEVLDRFLEQSKAIVLPKARSGAVPAWLRRPLLVIDVSLRDELLEALQTAGIGATAMYPQPVHKIPGIEGDLDLRGAPFDGAERVAESLIALPLVEGMTKQDLETITRTIAKMLGRKRMSKWA